MFFVPAQAALMLKGLVCGTSPPYHTSLFSRTLSSHVFIYAWQTIAVKPGPISLAPGRIPGMPV